VVSRGDGEPGRRRDGDAGWRGDGAAGAGVFTGGVCESPSVALLHRGTVNGQFPAAARRSPVDDRISRGRNGGCARSNEPISENDRRSDVPVLVERGREPEAVSRLLVRREKDLVVCQKKPVVCTDWLVVCNHQIGEGKKRPVWLHQSLVETTKLPTRRGGGGGAAPRSALRRRPFSTQPPGLRTNTRACAQQRSTPSTLYESVRRLT
jgi:hypothetical protein